MGTSISNGHQISVHKNPTPTQFLSEGPQSQTREICQTKGVWPFFELKNYFLVTLNKGRKYSAT
jgi:hypothetical protein